ncbi:MAG: hypothetical protein K8S56_05955 [Candidatus Cloacimonetes bacterium]|nr:hypothetical protein [Candidatus Cloacimonadota bacterium]
MIVQIDEEQALIKCDKIAKFIVERRMAPAAMMFIISLKPLSFIGSQVMYFLEPFAEVIFDAKEYQEFAALIERREYVDILINRIDELDEEMHREERKRRKIERKRQWNKVKIFFKKIVKK